MLDPAILHDLQRAMMPPSLPPLAVVRQAEHATATEKAAATRAMLAAGKIVLDD